MNLEEYARLAKTDGCLPVYYQPWYLDAVGGGDGWSACVSFIDENKWGILPFYLDESMGIKAVCVPPLTQYMGPFIHIDASICSPRRYLAEERIMKNLLEEAQTYGEYYAQKWGPWQMNWLPAYHCGFSQASRITFVINGTEGYSAVKHNYSSQVRNKLKNRARIEVREEYDPYLLYEIAEKSLRRINKALKYTLTELIRLTDACVSNEGGRQLIAFTQDGRPIASTLLLEDNTTVYYYLAGEDPEYRGKNAPTLLVDESIKRACTGRKRFDFTGSMIPGVSRFYQSFGAQVMNYHMISKDNRMDQSGDSSDTLNRKLLFRF